MNARFFPLVCLVVSAALGLAMIHADSLWIDEGQTLHFARQPSLQAFGHELVVNRKSEPQMPAGMAAAWVGARLLGTSEWSLRAVNLVWLALAGLAVGLAGRHLRLPWLLPLFLANPFLWFYVNEARPYTQQICAGAWLLLVLARIQSRNQVTATEVALLGLWGFLGFGASLLFGAAFVAVACAGGLILRRQRPTLVQGPALMLAAAFALGALAAIGSWQAYKLWQGAAGARLWTVSPVNLGFAFYETLGFSGLGPPRGELRELARTTGGLREVLLEPLTLLGLGALAMLYAAAVRRLWQQRQEPLVRWLTAAVVAGSLSLLMAAMVARFPFWGRHLAPLLAWIIALFAAAWPKRSPASPEAGPAWRQHGLAAALLVVLLVSSLTLRLSPRHRKDDYRGAAALALQALANGRTVWWSADPEVCAEYYGLTMAAAAKLPGKLVFAYQPDPGTPASWPEPDMVLVSKPDIHDHQRVVEKFVAGSSLRVTRQLTAFKVYTRPETVR